MVCCVATGRKRKAVEQISQPSLKPQALVQPHDDGSLENISDLSLNLGLGDTDNTFDLLQLSPLWDSEAMREVSIC